MGSPEFASTILISLLDCVNIVGVVTQPDRPAGRGKVLTSPPVKKLAQEAGITVFQPEKLRHPETFTQLEAWRPELIVVAAFGQILKQNVLDLPKHGCINVHASLLPRWRGAAPIQAAILQGDMETGVSIMQMDAGVDTGDIYSQRRIAIHSDDDSNSLSRRLAVTGAELLLETLPEILAGQLRSTPQDHALATYAPMIRKEDGLLDFFKSAETLARSVRAYFPWPGAYTLFDGQALKVLRASTTSWTDLHPAQRGVLNGQPVIGTPDGGLVLIEVQPAGKKPMTGKVFLNGARNWATPSPQRIDETP